jgi:methylene-tetrahydromethanopterin dehydrogenase
MVACVERVLKEKKQRDLKDLAVAIFGATGVVGFAAAVICAQQGAEVTLVGYDGPERVARSAEEMRKRFDIKVESADGSDDTKKEAILRKTEVALAAARAGLQVLSKSQIDAVPRLLVAADVNAVPPSGIEGLEMKANGDVIGKHGTLGIGPLAIGDVKYKTESGLFKAMIASEKAVIFDFRHAFDLARQIVGGNG